MSAKAQFSCLAMSVLFKPISFILSHPLYVSYFIFFSPYLIRLICFLSPLFITTFLLSVASSTSTEFIARSPVSNFAVSCSALLGWPKKDYDGDDRCHQTHLEALLYEVFFGCGATDAEDNLVPVCNEPSKSDPDEKKCEDSSSGDGDGDVVEEKTVLDPGLENESRSSNFLKILDGFERMSSDVEEKGKKGAKIDKVVGKGKPSKPASIVQKTNLSEEKETSAASHRNDVVVEFFSPKADGSRAMDYSNLGAYGSMRKEKEWKRTLACKLFEERHNVGGGEGMDSLWEAYEVDSDKQRRRHEKSSKKKAKDKSRSRIEFDDEDEEEMSGGGGVQLCCLQAAIKLSTGKMNLGMGKPNLVKISKAIKGFGWLRHASKHSKKVHNI